MVEIESDVNYYRSFWSISTFYKNMHFDEVALVIVIDTDSAMSERLRYWLKKRFLTQAEANQMKDFMEQEYNKIKTERQKLLDATRNDLKDKKISEKQLNKHVLQIRTKIQNKIDLVEKVFEAEYNTHYAHSSSPSIQNSDTNQKRDSDKSLTSSTLLREERTSILRQSDETSKAASSTNRVVRFSEVLEVAPFDLLSLSSNSSDSSDSTYNTVSDRNIDESIFAYLLRRAEAKTTDKRKDNK